MIPLREAFITKDNINRINVIKKGLWILLPYSDEGNKLLNKNYSNFVAHNETFIKDTAYVLTGKQIHEFLKKNDSREIEIYGWEKGDKDMDRFTQKSLISALKKVQKYTGNGNSLPGYPKYFTEAQVFNELNKME